MASSSLKQRAGQDGSQLEMLPPEIFEMVAGAVEDEDLLALRLASRECAAKVLTTYTNAHFTEILLKVRDDASLMKCLRICRHPVLRRAVQTIAISIDQCDHKGNRRCHVKHIRAFGRCGLVSLFGHLARYTKTKELRIVAREETRTTCTDGNGPFWNPTCKQVFMDIMHILKTSPLRVKSLDLATGADWGLPLSELTETELECLQGVMLPLERLSVSIWRNVCMMHQEDETINVCLKALASSKSLKNLSIDVQSCADVDPFCLMLAGLQFTALNSLQLRGGCLDICIHLPDLLRFVHSHKANLTTLQLSSIQIAKRDDTDENSDEEQGLAAFVRAKTGLDQILVDHLTNELFLE